MKRLLLLLALTGCTPDEYTWGNTSNQLAQIFCHGADYCGYLAPEDVGPCIEHTAWHLCEPDHTCDVSLDQDSTEALLTTCDTAVGGLDQDGCYLLGFWGFMPTECGPAFDLRPEAR